jgi:2-oxoisovalerate dehydrogenase E1 component alpha subunit
MSNDPALSLHIPVPPSRPGDPPEFSQLAVPDAGATRRPDVLTPEPDMRDMPYGMVRVLDDQGAAVGPWNPHLEPEALRRGLRSMLLTRLFDEHMFGAHREGKTSFYMKSTGEEAIGAATSATLARTDMCFPTYRMVSYLMARDYPLLDMVNQIFSNAADPTPHANTGSIRLPEMSVAVSAMPSVGRWPQPISMTARSRSLLSARAPRPRAISTKR